MRNQEVLTIEKSDSAIRQSFNRIASQYDSQRPLIIPCFDDFYELAVDIAEAETPYPAILDLGAGTGLLSAFILEKYPLAQLTLMDLSEEMLLVAQERFATHKNVEFIVADYKQALPPRNYDMIISALSIHHLDDQEKKQLFILAYNQMKPNGLFINADQVLGNTPEIDNRYKKAWREKVEKSGLTKEQLAQAYERTKLDRFSTLDDQLRWLKEAGFREVDCVYKYYNFTVYYGRK